MRSLLSPLEERTGPWLFVHGANEGPSVGIADRALVLAQARDIVCVTDEVDPAYLTYLSELGLGTSPERVVSASRFENRTPERALWARLAGNADALRALGALLRHSGSIRLHPLQGARGPFALAAALEVAANTEVRVAAGEPRAVELAGERHTVRTKAIQLGIPVADGEIVHLPATGGRRRTDHDLLRRAIDRWIRSTGRVIVRGAHGVGGSSTFVMGTGSGDVDALARELADRADNRVYLVEAMVAATVSPSVQLHVPPAGGPITCVGITDQRLSRSSGQAGSVAPSIAQTIGTMVSWAQRLAEWLQGEGYAGLLGLDFVEHPDPLTGAPRALLAEITPRVTASTYALAIFERLNAAQRAAGRPESSAFVSGSIETRPRGFEEFRRAAGHVLYSPATGSGVIPCQAASLGQGKCGVVVLGPSRDAVLRSYGELQTWCRREER